MGTDCTPLLANLFLFYYEDFSYSFRYVDDLLTLYNPNFEHEISKIYQPQLQLKKLLQQKWIEGFLTWT